MTKMTFRQRFDKCYPLTVKKTVTGLQHPIESEEKYREIQKMCSELYQLGYN